MAGKSTEASNPYLKWSTGDLLEYKFSLIWRQEFGLGGKDPSEARKEIEAETSLVDAALHQKRKASYTETDLVQFCQDLATSQPDM